MSSFNPDSVARRLNKNQRMVVVDLNIRVPVMFGCAEGVAFRLTRPSGSRPALTKHEGGGSFILTDEGDAVQEAISRLGLQP